MSAFTERWMTWAGINFQLAAAQRKVVITGTLTVYISTIITSGLQSRLRIGTKPTVCNTDPCRPTRIGGPTDVAISGIRYDCPRASLYDRREGFPRSPPQSPEAYQDVC